MSDIVPSDTRYIPFTQQRWCCVPACIQMVMYRHGIPLLPAELIGYHLGLTVPKKKLKYFWKGRIGKKPKAGWGTQIGEKEFEPNRAFKRLKIPLEMEFKLIGEFSDFSSVINYLRDMEEKDTDILACFDGGVLFNEKIHYGHVCVIDRVYFDKKEVRIIDSEYKAPKWRVVKIQRLYEAMKFHAVAAKKAGFWELNNVGGKL